MRFGIIGTNFISDRFLAALAFTEAKATAVFSRKRETGDAFAQKHAIGAVFTDLEAFLHSDVFDAVYVASPNFCHKEQTLAALRAGKHVLCEKPIAPSLDDYLVMKNEARARGLILTEAMRPIFDRMWLAIKDRLGALGTLRSVHLDYCQYSSRYDRFLSGEVLNAFNPALSNAALLDIGVYPIALAAFLFGKPHSVHSEVCRLANGFEGGGSILLGYGDFSAVITYSKVADSLAPSVIIGEKGGITVDKAATPKEVYFCPRGGERERIVRQTPDAEDNMFEEIRAFIRAVQERDTENTHEVSANTLAIMDAVRKEHGIRFPSDG